MPFLTKEKGVGSGTSKGKNAILRKMNKNKYLVNKISPGHSSSGTQGTSTKQVLLCPPITPRSYHTVVIYGDSLLPGTGSLNSFQAVEGEAIELFLNMPGFNCFFKLKIVILPEKSNLGHPTLDPTELCFSCLWNLVFAVLFTVVTQ